MIKFAPYISLYGLDDSKDLQTEVIWTFSSFLIGVSSVRSRFNIHIVNDVQQESKSLEGAVKSISKFVELDNFASKSEKEKKTILLDLITDAFFDVSEDLGWDKNMIIQARKSAIKQHITFNYLSKPKKNVSRTAKATLELILTKNIVAIWVHFSIKNNPKPIRKHLLDTYPEQVAFFRNFENHKWISDEQYGFIFSNGLTLSVSPNNELAKWSEMRSNDDKFFKKSIDQDETISVEEMIKLANS